MTVQQHLKGNGGNPAELISVRMWWWQVPAEGNVISILTSSESQKKIIWVRFRHRQQLSSVLSRAWAFLMACFPCRGGSGDAAAANCEEHRWPSAEPGGNHVQSAGNTGHPQVNGNHSLHLLHLAGLYLQKKLSTQTMGDADLVIFLFNAQNLNNVGWLLRECDEELMGWSLYWLRGQG